jgi:GT2 family glycosyltransferase
VSFSGVSYAAVVPAAPEHFPGDVALVVVAYDSDRDVVALLRRLRPHTAVVVDTGNDPGATASAVSGLAEYVDAGDNIGFARAANLGARHVLERYVLFCNPDAEPTALDVASLRSTLLADPRRAAVAPAVLDARGKARGGGGRRPSPRSALCTLLGPLASPAARIWLVSERARIYETEWLSGACLLIRADVFRHVGGFDERYPLYNEDMALGGRISRAGWRQALDGRVRVRHHSGGSARQASEQLWRWRGGALGHYVLSEAPAPRLTWAILLMSFALRAVAMRVTGRGDPAGWREWVCNAEGLWRAELPVLPLRAPHSVAGGRSRTTVACLTAPSSRGTQTEAS